MQTGEASTVRRPTEGDANAVVRIQRASFPWALPARPVNATRALFRVIERSEHTGRAPFFVAELDGAIVGYACAQPYAPLVGGEDLLSPDTPVAVVPQVAVVPNAQRMGIGEALLERIHGALGEAGFSMTLAHIRPELRTWYEHMGWTVLPENIGLAWIEPPSALNRRLLPAEAPKSAVATHTPLMHQPPMRMYGNTALAFRATAATTRIIVAAIYEASDDATESGRRAARSLIKELDGSGRASSIPPHSALMLQVSALEPDEATAWIAERWPVKPTASSSSGLD